MWWIWQRRDGTVCVVDLQLASPPQNEHAWHTARRALLGHVALQLAAPNTTEVWVGVLYLQDAEPSPRFARLGWSEIAAALSPLAELPSLPLPAHAVFGLVEQPLSICIQLSCEFRGFCHGTSDYIAPHAD